MGIKILPSIVRTLSEEDKTRFLTHSFAALLTVLFYVSLYRRRKAMLQMADTLSQSLRKVTNCTYKVQTHLFIAYLIVMQVFLAIALITRHLSEKHENSNVIIAADSSNPIMYYCNEFIRIFSAFASFLWFFALSLFALYYIFTCSFIRVLLEHVLERTDSEILPEDLENFSVEYGNIARCTRILDEHFSQPVFLAVFYTMAGLFWGGYRAAFLPNKGMTYSLTLLIVLIYYLSIQVLIMVSASITNELSSKVKCVMQCLSYQNFIQDPQRKFKFKKGLNQNNSLTLWNVYVMDRSLIITSVGTLLTYGIMIGTLGKNI
ncbi:uncharacterized protein TNIN_292801 [Trichonephila inaurata madagascariensis]|uniref:Gustatory receptor n=1 Tax=Trichonephila inaurata madagascariensis TaxID=2747483 RepID=A0A8X6IKQ9_9ARAC|nr:uncharacterized protein TNIN_292801 [Trichonephila inaurata madagascariensis]